MQTWILSLLIGTASIVPVTPHSVYSVFGEIVHGPVAEAATVSIEFPKIDPTHFPYEEIEKLVEKYATPLNVSKRSMLETIKCESYKNKDGTYDATHQSEHFSFGLREDSWGIVQINLPSHPTVSLSQAQDPEFSVKFMAEKFSEGNAKLWTCWRKLKEDGII